MRTETRSEQPEREPNKQHQIMSKMKWQYKGEKPHGKLKRWPFRKRSQRVVEFDRERCFCDSLLISNLCLPSAEVRQVEAAKIREKHPDRIPVSLRDDTAACMLVARQKIVQPVCSTLESCG